MEFVFREPGRLWVRVSGSEDGVVVSYQPKIVRSGMKLLVYDFNGDMLDEHELLHSAPEHAERVICTMAAQEWEEATRWVADHLSTGMVMLRRVEELIDEGQMQVMNGVYYEVDGVVGRLILHGDIAVLMALEGEEIHLLDAQIKKLWPAGDHVQPIAR